MGARGVAMQDLSQKELDGRDGREHAVAPGGIADLLTRADDGFWQGDRILIAKISPLSISPLLCSSYHL